MNAATSSGHGITSTTHLFNYWFHPPQLLAPVLATSVESNGTVREVLMSRYT